MTHIFDSDSLEEFDLTNVNNKIIHNDTNISEDGNNVVSDYQVNTSHNFKGYNQNDFKIIKDNDPHLSYLFDTGLIGKNKTRYIRKYFNINSKDRDRTKIIKDKIYSIEDNSLEVFHNNLIIHNLPNNIEPNTKIHINCEINKNICLRSEFTNNTFTNNNIENLFILDNSESKTKLLINDSYFDNYCGKVIIDNLIGDDLIKIFFINYTIELDENENENENKIIISDDDMIFIIITIDNNNKVSHYELFPQEPHIKNRIEQIVINHFKNKLILLPSDINVFLNNFNDVIPFIRQIISKNMNDYVIDKKLLSDTKITKTNFYNNIPINIINDCKEINNNMICLDTIYENNNILLENNVLTYYQHQVSDISFSFDSMININDKILTITEVKTNMNNKIGLIDLKCPNMKKFGSNIQISTIKNITYGHDSPSNYLYNFSTTINNIVSIKIISTIFPKLKTFIKKSKLFYQTINDGNDIRYITIPEGVYNDVELEEFINNCQDIFTIKIRCNNNLIQFNSNLKIRIRFDLPNSIDLGFPDKTIFSNFIRNDEKYISSIKNKKINFDLFGFDYIIMSIDDIKFDNINDKDNKFFYKINMKEHGNNNLNYCQNNKLYDTFVDTPILLNEPIKEISKLNIKFYDPSYNEISFDIDHSFVLEFICINDIPYNTNIKI
jgi:hypothetical protein